MRFFLTSLRLNVKKLALRRAVLVSLILLPISLSVGAIFLVDSDISPVSVTAGVYFDNENLLGTEVFNALTESVSDTPFINFVLYDNLDALIYDVRFGRIECGYVITPQIENAADAGFDGVVTLITSDRSVLSDGLNELVAAALLKVSSESIARTWLYANFDETADIGEFVASEFERYRQSDIFMTPLHIAQTGPEEDVASSLSQIAANRVMHGLIGLSIIVLFLFYIPALIDEQNSGLRISLSACGRGFAYDTSLFAAMLAVNLLIGFAGLTAMVFFSPHLLSDALTEIMALKVFAAVNALLVMLAVRLLRSKAPVQSLGLFLVLANIFFGGVLLDLYEISPELARVQQFFPLFWYIDSIMGCTS
ncbi:MAG: hypothetical protein FWC13_12375 [Oscillospiraceae bacterium]|nr:hypothetical protein [Oscillospiraceae bacterium]